MHAHVCVGGETQQIERKIWGDIGVIESISSVLQCAAVCCSVLQCVAVWRSVLQCVAVCCGKKDMGGYRSDSTHQHPK